MGASPWTVSDDVWQRIELLLPVQVPGRKPLPDRSWASAQV